MITQRWRWTGITAAFVLAGVVTAVVISSTTVGPVLQDKPVGSLVISADGLTLISSNGGCDDGHLEVRETKTTVTAWLRLHDTVMLMPGLCAIRSFSATLKAPLGARSLVDGVTHKALPSFDGKTILRPSNLPAGFVHRYDTASLGDDPVREFTAGCLQVYSKGDSYDDTLLISQDVGAHWKAPDGVQEQAITVRGVPGTAIPGEIAWTEKGQLFTIKSMTYAYATPSTEQLIVIANSLG